MIRYLILPALLFFFPIIAATTEIPDPVDLSIGWWIFFEDKDENKDHIDQLVEYLKKLKSQLDIKKQPLTEIQIDNLILSAEELKKKRSEKKSYQEIHPLYLSTYRLSDYAEVIEKIRVLKSKEEKEFSQKNRMQHKADQLRSELDYLQLEYPLQKEGSLERLLAGLQIMTARFDIANLEIDIKNKQKNLIHLEEDQTKLAKEKEIAEGRLQIADLDKKEILQNLEEREALLIRSKKRLLELDGSEAVAETRGIELLAAKIQVQLVESKIVYEKLKLLFIDFENKQPRESLETKSRELADRTNKIQSSADELQRILQTFTENIDEASSENLTKMKEATASLNELMKMVSHCKALISLLMNMGAQMETTVSQFVSVAWHKITGSVNFLWEGFSYRLFRINDYPVSFWVLIRSIAFLVIGILLGSFVYNRIKNFNRLKYRLGRVNLYIIARIFYYTILIAALLVACFSLGFDMTNFVIIAGALGVGAGLGLQSIVNNFFSGLLILFSKILKVGDIVETEGQKEMYKGYVRSINMQNTHIRTFDGKDVLVPNADFVTKKVINWTLADPYIRLHVPFGVEYGVDKDKVEKIVLKVAEKLPFTIQDEVICPKPKVWMVKLGDNALELELVVWVNIKENSSKGNMIAEYLWEIERELLKAGIELPCPQREIRIREVPDISVKTTKK